MRLRTLAAVATLTATAALLTGCAAATPAATSRDVSSVPHTAAATASPSAAPAAAQLTQAQVDALPRLTFDTVVPGLIADTTSDHVLDNNVYRLAAPVIVYGDQGQTPVGVLLTRTSVEQQPYLTRIVERRGDWARVLTPNRKTLPSKDPSAPAQTSGWIQYSRLVVDHVATQSVQIDLATRQLSILDASGSVVESHPVSVGATATPTPAVTTILANRYQDPNQAAEGVINLLDVHSTTEDTPLEGGSNGTIALHGFPTSTGQAISHGCVRLDAAGAAAVGKLPLGTIVTIVP
jgi:lipoprotein-anchoring transpeptidase ErfK/SrfK